MSPISTPIPQDYSQWRSTVERHIHAAPEDHQFFWLIDPCAHEDLPGIIRKLDPQADPWPLYMDTYLDEAKNSGPFMVPYRTDSEFTGWMLRELRALPLGSLIEVESASAHIAFEHFQNLLECLVAGGGQYLFRFYDPRILYAVSTYGDQTMMPRILGPALYLDAWEPGRCVPVRMGSGSDSGIRCSGMEEYEEHFIHHIWDEVDIHSIIGTLGREPGMILRSMPLPESYQLVSYVHTNLLRYGYQDKRSLAYGASVTARLGTEIWQQQSVIDAFEDRPPQAPIDEVFTSIDFEQEQTYGRY